MKFTRTITITKIERQIQILPVGAVVQPPSDTPADGAPGTPVPTDSVPASEPEDNSGTVRPQVGAAGTAGGVLPCQ